MSVTTYQLPLKPIVDLVDAPPTPSAGVSPDRRTIVLVEHANHGPVADLAQPELRLAGLRINPRTSGPSRRVFATGLVLVDLASGAHRRIGGLRPGARIGDLSWSPDSARLALTITSDDRVNLWIADVATATARPLVHARLCGAYGPPYDWLSSSALLCKLVADDRGAPPVAPTVPQGPIVQENRSGKAPARTYQDLLKNPHDEALFDYHLRSQLARVDLDGTITPVGGPHAFLLFSPSPDGEWLLVTIVHRPYSYRVPVSRFPYRSELWDLSGRLVRRIADLPLAEEVPVNFAAVPTGPRSYEWRADAGATLLWAEARDGGDPRTAAEIRDEVLSLAAPFDGEPQRLAALALRYGGVTWSDRGFVLVDEWWWTTRRSRTWVVNADAAAPRPPRVLFDRSTEDRYGDPGRPVLRPTPRGTRVLLTSPDGGDLFLVGPGASTEGDLPFINRFHLATGRSERLWRCEAPWYEAPLALLDDRADALVTRRESVDEPPQFFLRRLGDGSLRRLTDLPHPAPWLGRVNKRLLRYRRADGVKLTGMLYLPPGYDPARDGPRPALFWVYPHEFKSADAAGQVTDSPHRFARIDWGSPLFALLLGYVVVDDPSLPIVGEGDVEPNDTYVQQLTAGAEAAVSSLAEAGVVNRERLAIGGHSYGAFTTANLLAHTRLFRAGIARSGAYNRTLTPFSFQAEERNFWQASRVYIEMSPFTHADRIEAPLLLIHGDADSNPGTYPMQSERMFEALKGLGRTVRLVSLPHESHGYRGRESILHTLWEMVAWLERHVGGVNTAAQDSGAAASS